MTRGRVPGSVVLAVPVSTVTVTIIGCHARILHTETCGVVHPSRSLCQGSRMALTHDADDANFKMHKV